MKCNVKVLQIIETEPPALLAECINDVLFERIKMAQIPVLIQSISGDRTHGFCSYGCATEYNEIVIAAELFDVRSSRLRARQLEEILDVYLHECAHRLTNEGHTAAFLCVNMILHLRAKNRQIWHVKIYDVHEEKYFKQSWQWAWELAQELYETDITAEQCTEIVLDRYKAWQSWMSCADERLAQAEVARQAVVRNHKKDTEHIQALKKERWHFAFYSMLVTVLTVSFFN